MIINIAIPVVAVAVLAGACLAAAPGGGQPTTQPLTLPAQAPAGPAWAANLPIYEAEVERQTPEGTFAAFQKRLPEIKSLGVGIVWLMPIHPRGGNPPDKPKSASPYCVRDYYDVHAPYGTKDDFRRLVKAIHEQGMYVLMDWVPNHTAWGNDLIRKHPEYYAKDKDGHIRQAGPWSDVAQLDYANRDLWEYMYQARKYWIEQFDVDGFREDVAGAVPVEHWKWLRPKLDALKAVFMLAEAQDPPLHPAFDMTYDWEFQPVFWKIVDFGGQPALIDHMLADARRVYPGGAVRMRHATNHDMQYLGYAWDNRPRIDIKFLETAPLADKYKGGLRAYEVLAATLPGGKPMIWNGQEMGIVAKTPHPLRWQVSEWREFYTKLFGLYRRSPAVWKGEFAALATDGADRCYAFRRSLGREGIVVAVNLCERAQSFALRGAGLEGRYVELFTGKARSLTDGERLSLGPWEYCVYERRPDGQTRSNP